MDNIPELKEAKEWRNEIESRRRQLEQQPADWKAQLYDEIPELRKYGIEIERDALKSAIALTKELMIAYLDLPSPDSLDRLLKRDKETTPRRKGRPKEGKLIDYPFFKFQSLDEIFFWYKNLPQSFSFQLEKRAIQYIGDDDFLVELLNQIPEAIHWGIVRIRFCELLKDKNQSTDKQARQRANKFFKNLAKGRGNTLPYLLHPRILRHLVYLFCKNTLLPRAKELKNTSR